MVGIEFLQHNEGSPVARMQNLISCNRLIMDRRVGRTDLSLSVKRGAVVENRTDMRAPSALGRIVVGLKRLLSEVRRAQAVLRALRVFRGKRMSILVAAQPAQPSCVIGV